MIKKEKALVNNFQRGPLANCIALHGFTIPLDKIDFKGWIHYMIDFFAQSGLIPTRIGLTGAWVKSEKITLDI